MSAPPDPRQVCGLSGYWTVTDCGGPPLTSWERLASDAELAQLEGWRVIPSRHMPDVRLLTFACAEHRIDRCEAEGHRAASDAEAFDCPDCQVMAGVAQQVHDPGCRAPDEVDPGDCGVCAGAVA